MSKTLVVLLSVVVLGGVLLVAAGENPLVKGGAVWAGSGGARVGVGTSAGVGGGMVGVGPGVPARGAAGTPAAVPQEYVH